MVCACGGGWVCNRRWMVVYVAEVRGAAWGGGAQALHSRKASAHTPHTSRLRLPKVAATLPFGIISAACFHLVVYGMTGLRHGASAAAQSCTLGVLGYLVAAQVREASNSG